MESPITDDRLVLVLGKIRDAKSRLTSEYEKEYTRLGQQEKQVTVELLRRLHERGATQTKTPHGTVSLGVNMQASIADENVYFNFIRETGDLDFFQRRIKIAHLKEYMEVNEGRVPPGLNIFKEQTINLRRNAGETLRSNGDV